MGFDIESTVLGDSQFLTYVIIRPKDSIMVGMPLCIFDYIYVYIYISLHWDTHHVLLSWSNDYIGEKLTVVKCR